MSPYSNKKSINHNPEAGMTLVITLLLVLTLTVMASAVTFVVNNHSDMTNAVTNKPVAIESADACIEEAIAWVQTSVGHVWLEGTEVTGVDALGYGKAKIKDIAASDGSLYGKNLKLHTEKKSGETRSAYFQKRLEKASCTSVNMTVIKKTAGVSDGAGGSVLGVGEEIGSKSGYGDIVVEVVEFIPYKYEILVVAEGFFNLATIPNATGVGVEIDKSTDFRLDPTSNWTNSSISKVEVLFTYQQ